MQILDQSLCQLAGITPMTEIALRSKGIWTTRQLMAQADSLFSPRKAAKLREAFSRIELARKLGLVDILVNAMPCGHRVRVLADYYPQALFIDVETSGISSESMRITCISTCLNGKTASFVSGQNLECFLNVWAKARIVVTFNGKRFDVPLLQREFDLSTLPAHIDLMDEARHFGYVGGLKAIEARIGFFRKKTMCESGSDAPMLWQRYLKEDDREALDELVKYNQEDVRSLTELWRILLKHSIQNTGISTQIGQLQ